MVHISFKYAFLILSLSFCLAVDVDAQIDCDRNCSYDFIEKNDTTIELHISINGYSSKFDYFKLKSDKKFPLPIFQGRYKDCLVFMVGYGQHYRLLTVFQISNGQIIRDEYEHTMCLETDIKESYLFFYDSQPIKMTYNYMNSKVKFKKLRNKNKYSITKGETIVSCKNKFYTITGQILIE